MRGFSLPVVMFTLSLGSALAVGGAYVTRQMASSARGLSRSAAVEAAASEWLARSIISGSDFESLEIGALLEMPPIVLGEARIRRWATRTDSSVCWLVVEAESDRKPLQRIRLGAALVRRDSAWLLAGSRALVELP